MMFNVNNTVRVKLTKHGKKILRERFNEMHRAHPTVFKNFSFPDEEDGWSEWQMWNLMSTFGAHIHMGGNLPFENTIEIVE